MQIDELVREVQGSAGLARQSLNRAGLHRLYQGHYTNFSTRSSNYTRKRAL